MLPLESKKAQKTARRSGAERNSQCYLFGCLCHGGYKLYSLLCGTKTKTEQNKQKSPQVPEKQQEGMQEVLTGHTDPGGVVNAARAFNAHPTFVTYTGLSCRVGSVTDLRGLRNQAKPLSLPLCDFPSLPCLLQG